MKFNKPSKSPEELIEVYKERGLLIENTEEALHALEYIGHYRLSGYARSFQSDIEKHVFYKGSKFSEVLNLYLFDQDLRFLLSNYLAKIEIGIRKSISSYMYIKYDPHWFMDYNLFNKAKYCDIFQEEIIKSTGKSEDLNSYSQKKREIFFEHYYTSYKEPSLPPSWMIEEALTFGKWSVVYSNLRRQDKKQISEKFDLAPEILESWLHSLVYLRNLCVHHGRLWNRTFRVPPKIMKEHRSKIQSNETLYYYIVVMEGLLKFIDPSNCLNKEVSYLFNSYPNVDKEKIGFFNNWQRDGFWDNSKNTKVA